MARILSISYDDDLLVTRHLLLERQGHSVISAMGFAEAIEKAGPDYDVIIIGHSMPQKDKRAVIAELRDRGCTAPVLGLLRANEPAIPEVTAAVLPDPQQVLDAVNLLASRGSRA